MPRKQYVLVWLEDTDSPTMWLTYVDDDGKSPVLFDADSAQVVASLSAGLVIEDDDAAAKFLNLTDTAADANLVYAVSEHYAREWLGWSPVAG